MCRKFIHVYKLWMYMSISRNKQPNIQGVLGSLPSISVISQTLQNDGWELLLED